MAERPDRPTAPRRPSYELPSEYGPARSHAPADRDEHLGDDDGRATVRTVPRDAAVTDPEPPLEPAEPTTMTRRERRQATPAPAGAPRSRTTTWIWRGAGIVVLIVMVPVMISYVNKLRGPGTDSLGVRSVEWVREHGGNGVVNTIERWWYTNNPPPTGGDPTAIKVRGTADDVTASTKTPTATTAPPPQHLTAPSARVPSPAPAIEQNEGVWLPVGRTVGGFPAVYTTYVRPDAAHTSYWVGLMWLDTKLLRGNYVVGLNEPGGGPNPYGSQIPPDQRGFSIAAFNSGFKIDQARGGAYLDGQEIRPLVAGSASLIIKKDGSTNVGIWGRDANMSPDIQAVRQNLELLVDNGQLNPELREDDTVAFGATLGNNVFVWRSGVGVTAEGALIYAGGPAMSVMAVARTLQNAGAVRAMELDINTDWVSGFFYQNENPVDPNTPTVGIKLLDNMSRGGDRYLVPGERDFFFFTADPKAPTAATTTTSSSTTTSTTTKQR